MVNSVRGFDVEPGQSLLDAALQASFKLPHRCRGGNCGLCTARVVRGETFYPNGRPLGLSDAQLTGGCVLLCQARARSDLEVELREVRAADQAATMRLPCRIERAIRVAPDVMRVLLRRPPALDFAFKPGQYLDVLLPDGGRRSFSIASPPHDSALLELHVRRVEGGEFSEWLFGADAAASSSAGALIDIEGPFGGFFYREGPAGAGPILLVGGGTGLAPLLSILRHLRHHRIIRESTLYWGVRGTHDLYAEDALRELLAGAPQLRYVPVLSRPGSDWQGRTGYVHAAVLEDIGNLGGHDIYGAGPPEMIEAVRREFTAHGAQADRLFCDSFDYAPGAPPRQRTSADTSS